VRGASAHEQCGDRRDHRDQHPTDCLHVLPSYVDGGPGRPTVLLSVRGPTARPHTTHGQDVTQMRDLTCCSYVSLIVDTRNITGRHRPGNAWASFPPIPPHLNGSLLKCPGHAQVRATGPIVLQLRVNPAPFASHISDRFMTRTATCRFVRSTRNRTSIMVRRDIVPQPHVMLGGNVGRKTVMLVSR